MSKIGFIGIGNMGTPMILSLVRSGKFKAEQIEFFDIDKIKVAQLAEEIGRSGFKPFETSIQMIAECDLVVLAVKPQIYKIVLGECAGLFTDKIMVSIVAGISTELLEIGLGEGAKVVRAMPNTPCQIGEGMTLLSKGANTTRSEFEEVIEIFKTFGLAEELPEKLMNEVIALTASSPAYVFVMIEAMADAAVQAGIPRATAYRLAAQAVQGSAKLVLETGKQPGELKDAVCSPGGTTIEAVAKLEEKGFRSAIIEAMGACTDKAKSLAKS
ncbi:MAG: pyrroline-5-carboxylate reductase [Bacillota bacterium]